MQVIPTSCILCRTGEMVSFFVFSRNDSTAFPTPPSIPRTEPCLLRITDMAMQDHANPSRRRMSGFRKDELLELIFSHVGPSATPTQSSYGTSMQVCMYMYQLLSDSASMHCRVHSCSPSPSCIDHYLLNQQ